MADSFSWLHLTDLHYGLKGQGCLWPNLRQPFLDDLAELHQKCGPWDAVLFTGDLVHSGATLPCPAQFRRVAGPSLKNMAICHQAAIGFRGGSPTLDSPICISGQSVLPFATLRTRHAA